MDEIWKDIEGYEDCYQVSNFGRVLSKKSGLLRKFGDNGNGYKFVPLSNGMVKNFYVHRLVADAFIPNPDRKQTVNHKDGIKSNNHVSNIEWATQSENSQHGFDNGLINALCGREHPFSKPVLQFNLNGLFVCRYATITDASTANGICSSAIGAACRRKFKQAGGFQWRYESEESKTMRINSTGKKWNGEKPVFQISKIGEVIKLHESVSEASRKTGICYTCISDCANGKLKTSGGFVWKFKEKL